MSGHIKITALGQVGFLFEYKDTIWLIDPYLSDYVEATYGESFRRQVPLYKKPEELFNIDFVLITHEHEDHCDPVTIEKILSVNPNCNVYAPSQCNPILRHIKGIKLKNPKIETPIRQHGLRVIPYPVAHPDFSVEDGHSRWLGFLMVVDNSCLFHAGDTIPVEFSGSFPNTLDLAFIPINERNIFKEEQGIVGNMTCREALNWADRLNAKQWVPTHWDMFKGNDCPKEELDTISKHVGLGNYTWLETGQQFELKIT